MSTLLRSIFQKTLIIFFIVTFYLQKVEPFGKLRPEQYKKLKKECNIPKAKIKNLSLKENEMNVSDTDNYIDPHCDCNILEKEFVQSISYQPTGAFSTSCGAVDVSFNSACVRCGMCLAIAQQINQTLINVHETMSPVLWLNEIEVTFILRTICNHSFEHYSLREIDGNYLICDRLPGTTLVTSSVDGLWEKHLKKKCNEYLDEMGPKRLYERWQRWCNGYENNQESPDLSTVLCRDDTSFFRDCKSIDEDHNHKKLPSENLEMDVKILTEFKWR